ncbi:MAG: zinc ABC transporter substrate-binding protein [Marinobacter sp.]|nr:zinc ABC transporter substrate-binding protein [Marinobacter sp.]
MILIQRFVLGLIMAGALVAPAHARLQVFACEPEWAWLVTELLPSAQVFTATHARQDPHYVEARPGLIAAMRRADLAVCTGASLEAGWLPMLQQRSGNRRVQPGATGLFMAADHVTLRHDHDHVHIDRTLGDVHPEGDPHFQLDPGRLAVVAAALAQRLMVLQPEEALSIQRRSLQWQANWARHQARWRVAAAQLQGLAVVTQHSSFDYLLYWLGVEKRADLEPKPGLPPTASHLRDLLVQLQRTPAQGILVASYQNERPAVWLSQQTGLPYAVVPATVDERSGHGDMVGLIDYLIATLAGFRTLPE